MKDDFVTGRIASHGIDVSVPTDAEAIAELHRIIQKELTYNDVRDESKSYVTSQLQGCLLYTSPSPRDQRGSRMPSSA